MSETTPTERVLPARERAESSAKKRAASPPPPSAPASEPRQKRKYTKRASLIKTATPGSRLSTPSTLFEGALPSKLHSAKPLPTTTYKQPEKLSPKEYQSVAESAVLAASLHRSRMKWLCEGVFKKYWTKPVKRKGVIEQPPGNPDVKSMSKVGNATMTIEPHVFDVTFYTVKDLSGGPGSYQRHPNQHTVKQSQPPSTPVIAQQQQQQPPPPPPPSSQPTVNASATVSKPPTPVSSTTTKPTTNAPIKQEIPTAPMNPVASSSSKPSPPVQKPPVAHPPTQSVAPASSSNGGPKQSTDPVIQMLASRAATDNRLKDLMKVVALSQATVEQLKEFQAHIDEFNKIIKQQEAKKGEGEKAKSVPAPAPAPAAAHPATYKPPPRPYPGPVSSTSGPIHMTPPAYTAYPPPRAEPFIKHVVVEFHSTPSTTQSASTDRWLFPEYAVLDIKSGGMEMTASFFIVRKGEDLLGSHTDNDNGDDNANQKYQAGVEYYQPVTIVIKATQHRTIETIARAAKPLVDCQKYMKEVMDTKTRAPLEYLVHQLPRDKALTDIQPPEFVDSAVEMSGGEDDELRDVYGM